MVAHVNRAYQLGGWQSPCSPVLFAQEGITASGIRKSFCKSPVQEKGLCHNSGPVGSSVFLSVLGSCAIFSPAGLCSTGCSHKSPD